MNLIFPTIIQYGPRYDWSAKDQGLILGAFFYGYLITCLPGGILAERFGGKRVAGYCLMIGGFLTALTPPVSKLGVGPVFALRFLTGFFGVTIFTNLYKKSHNNKTFSTGSSLPLLP